MGDLTMDGTVVFLGSFDKDALKTTQRCATLVVAVVATIVVHGQAGVNRLVACGHVEEGQVWLAIECEGSLQYSCSLAMRGLQQVFFPEVACVSRTFLFHPLAPHR